MAYPGQYAVSGGQRPHEPRPVMVDTTGDGIANGKKVNLACV